jgi:peptide/nickel transport system permease protein
MIGYLVRRAGTSLVVLVGISLVMFGMLHLIFPSPAIVVLGPRTNIALINAWNAEHGFDRPWLVQYFSYIVNALHGNFGWSYRLNQSVSSLLNENWARSAYLSGAALMLSLVIAFPLGIFQAVRRNRVSDQVLSATAFTVYAMPDYFLYLIAIWFLAFKLPIFGFEASQSTSIWRVMADWHDMTLPIVCLALLNVAGYSRYMRSEAIDQLTQDYVRACRAKGLPERLVLWRHLLRNACLPMITLIGLSIPALLAGNLIAEYFFNYPGLGLLFVDALGNEDYPVLMAYTMIGAALTVAGNYLADVSLTVADPRIRLA